MKQESLQFESVIPDPVVVPPPVVVEAPIPVAQPMVLTVTQLTQQIKGALEGGFPDVWVVGEVSNFRPHSSGHWFFRLKDEQSVLESVIFRGINQKLPFKLEEGMELVCHGRLNVYVPHGKYSFVVDSAEPKGVGALQIAFEQLKKKLAAEGLFDARHKKALPRCPRCVGIVTAATGAAIRDMIHVIRRRWPMVRIVLAPAKVQGEGSAASVAEGIITLDRSGECDVIIAGRGGGSVEDLWAFNEELVARTIFAATTPIVSAVGHEIDFTIADFVADVRAPTPSAAAELVVPNREDVLATLRDYRRQLAISLQRWWEARAQRLRDLIRRLRPPTARFPDLEFQIASCSERLVHSMAAQLRERRAHLQQLAAELQHLSPLAVLAKGYAVVSDATRGVPLRRAQDARVGDRVAIQLAEGGLIATVDTISVR